MYFLKLTAMTSAYLVHWQSQVVAEATACGVEPLQVGSQKVKIWVLSNILIVVSKQVPT